MIKCVLAISTRIWVEIGHEIAIISNLACRDQGTDVRTDRKTHRRTRPLLDIDEYASLKNRMPSVCVVVDPYLYSPSSLSHSSTSVSEASIIISVSSTSDKKVRQKM